MGANGAGKSTLVKILTGAVRPDGGTITVRGREHMAHSPAEARRGGIVSVYQEPALIPDLDIRSNLRLTETPVEPFRHWLAELGLEDLDLSSMARRPAAGLAPGHRPRPRAGHRARRADARRDDRGPAREPDRARPRGHRPPARRRPLGHLHLPSDDRDRRRLRPRDRPARGRDRRRRRRHRGLRGADRRAHARRHRRGHGGGRRTGASGGPVGRREAPHLRPKPRRAAQTAGRLVRPLPGRGARRRRARGPGPGRAVRHPRRLRTPDERRAARRRLARLLPPSGRRHPGGSRLRAGRPRRGAADAALGAREHRAAVHRLGRAAGARSTPARSARKVDDGDQPAPDRHARAGRGPPAVGRQPAEGHDRALGRRRRPDDAVLRPDPRHRHPDQAADLRAASRPGGGRRRGPALHLGAQGDPARLRPGDRHLRRPGGRRDRRSPTPTSRRCCGPPTTCRSDAPMPEEIAAELVAAEAVAEAAAPVDAGPVDASPDREPLPPASGR